MIEKQNDWLIKYHTVVVARENPKVVGWSWANDSMAYKGSVHDDTILVHIECNETWGTKKKCKLYILEYNIDIIHKSQITKERWTQYNPTTGACE